MKKCLPKDKLKAESVIQELSKKVSIDSNPSKPSKSQSEAKKAAENYFLEDTTSTLLPGKNDVKTFVVNGEKKKMNVRVLQGSLRDHYKDFKDQNDIKIGFTTFTKSLPINVKTFKHMPQYSCQCKYHENVKFAFNSLRPYFYDKSIASHSDLIQKITCAKNSFECMTSACQICSDVRSLIENELIQDFDGSEKVKLTQWGIVENKPAKVICDVLLENLVPNFSSQIVSFKFHSYVHNVQAKKFKKDANEFQPESATLIFDFSEKYLNILQNEVQTAFFNRLTWSIFTAAAYTADMENETMKVETFGIISDESKQDKFSSFSFMKRVLDDVLKYDPNIKIINIWTDGSSAQFKNIFSISNIMYFEWIYDVKINWNFHATSHGKCIVDGVGGSIKNTVYSRVKSQNIVMNSAHDFYLNAKLFCKGIKIFYNSSQDVTKDKEIISPYFTRFKSNPIKKFRSCHHFEAIGQDTIKSSTTHLCEDENFTKIPKFIPPKNN